MTQRMNWEKAAVNRRPKLSIKDEQEFLARSLTTRWLERAERADALRRQNNEQDRKQRPRERKRHVGRTRSK